MADQVTDLESLPLIFDRRQARHPWHEAFRELEGADLTRGLVCRNWRMNHFPSPPGYPYGITMPLNAGQRGAFREVLHPPLMGQLAIEACRYPLVRLAGQPVADQVG